MRFVPTFRMVLGALVGCLVSGPSLADTGDQPRFPDKDWLCIGNTCSKRAHVPLQSVSGIFEGAANLHRQEKAGQIAALRAQSLQVVEVTVPSMARLYWDVSVDRAFQPQDWPDDIGLGNASVNVRAVRYTYGREKHVLKSGALVPGNSKITFEVRQDTYGTGGDYVTFYPAKWQFDIRYAEVAERGIVFRKGKSPQKIYRFMNLNLGAEHPARITHHKGEITVIQHDNGSATVLTGPDGRAEICLEHNPAACGGCCTYVRMNANSHLDLPARDFATFTKSIRKPLFLQGELYNKYFKGKVDPDRLFEHLDEMKGVETPRAVAGVRGTEFDLNVQENGATTLRVIEGEVAFAPIRNGAVQDGEAVLVGAGQKAAAIVRDERTQKGWTQTSRLIGPATWERSVRASTGEPYPLWWEWQTDDGLPWKVDYAKSPGDGQIPEFQPPAILSAPGMEIADAGGGNCRDRECREPLLAPVPDDTPAIRNETDNCVAAECREPDIEPSATYKDGTPVLGDPVPANADALPVPPDDPDVTMNGEPDCGDDLMECRPPKDQPALVEVPEAPSENDKALDLAFWESVKNSDNPAAFAAYLEAFPKGVFAGLARVKIAELSKSAPAPTASPPPPALSPAEMTQAAQDRLAELNSMDPAQWPQEAAKPIAMLTQAAEAGHAEAWIALAYVHEAGLGPPQDFAKAVALYTRAGEDGLSKGFVDAMALADQTGQDDALVEAFLKFYQASPYDGLQTLDRQSNQARVAVQAFLKKHGTYEGAPDGKFGKMSVAALDAYLAGGGKPASGTHLASDLQRELKRVGCYDMAIDGAWGPGSARALKNFNRWAGHDLPTEAPSEAALEALHAATGAVCGID